MKAGSKPSGSSKRKPEWEAGIQQQKRQKLQHVGGRHPASIAKGVHVPVACVLPPGAPVPVKAEQGEFFVLSKAVKAEQPEEQSEVAHHGLGLTWESF